MLNFDPRRLGAYVPPEHSSLARAVEVIISKAAEAAIHAAADMISTDLLPYDEYIILKKEKECWELGFNSGEILNDPLKLNWGWRFLWTHLIDGTCIAKAVDERCTVHEIDAHYWTTKYATETFFSGEVRELPPYKPRGRVVMSDSDIEKLGTHHYQNSYRSIMPSAPGIVENYDQFEELYAKSVMGEIVSIVSRRPGASQKHDKEAFLIETFALIQRFRVFKSKAELVRFASDAYVASSSDNRRPSPRWADEVVGKIWDRLGLKDTPVSELRRIRRDALAIEQDGYKVGSN